MSTFLKCLTHAIFKTFLRHAQWYVHAEPIKKKIHKYFYLIIQAKARIKLGSFKFKLLKNENIDVYWNCF